MKNLFLWVLMAGSSFWANAQAQIVVAWYYQEWSITQDSLNYKYNTGTNQLQYITDNVANNVSTTDIDNQNPNNYIYDKSGNMVADNSQSMSVSWSPYGKILTNTKAGGANLTFGYNAMQQRVLKRVVVAGDTTRTYYIRDAQGNTMGVYTRHNDSVTWREQYIFGSSRLGLYRADTLVNKGLLSISKLYEGKRNYEPTNHLGNVMAVINDRKTDSLSGTTKVGFNAVVISATDYYPFGMAIDSRSYTSSLYRYGFNGKENDKETGEQDYGMRFYDSKVPHFLSVDPLFKKYPQYSPYIFAGDNPIMAVDLDGAEPLQKVKDNQYEKIDILANYGDYHKTGHNYFAIKASADMYWYIRVTTSSTTYSDKTFEYWDGHNYVPYIPSGYSDGKEAFKSTVSTTGKFGLYTEAAIQTTVNLSATYLSGGIFAEATGTARFATGFKDIFENGLKSKVTWGIIGVKLTSAGADASVQYGLNGNDWEKVSILSPLSQAILTNPFMSSLSGSFTTLSYNDIKNRNPETSLYQQLAGNSVLNLNKSTERSAGIFYGGIGNYLSGKVLNLGIKLNNGHILFPSTTLNFTSNTFTNAGGNVISNKLQMENEFKKYGEKSN